MKTSVWFIAVCMVNLTLVACGNQQVDSSTLSATASKVQTPEPQDPEALAAAIGPVKQLTLAEQIDAALVQQGEQLFNTYCIACHRLDERFIGPPLGKVAQNRGPLYLMNVMLNPNGMIQRHPVMKDLVKEYGTLMTDLSLTETQARAILEYLRQVSKTS